MALPTDANVSFLLCDEVRQTPDGKLDLAGYFPVDEIKIDPSAHLPGEIHLTFVFVLKDGDGQFEAVLRLVDPLGKELHEYRFDRFEKLAGFRHIVMLRVTRIPIIVLGVYEVSLEIEGQRYRRPVRIYQ
jgi:hypothetical protein